MRANATCLCTPQPQNLEKTRGQPAALTLQQPIFTRRTILDTAICIILVIHRLRRRRPLVLVLVRHTKTRIVVRSTLDIRIARRRLVVCSWRTPREREAPLPVHVLPGHRSRRCGAGGGEGRGRLCARRAREGVRLLLLLALRLGSSSAAPWNDLPRHKGSLELAGAGVLPLRLLILLLLILLILLILRWGWGAIRLALALPIRRILSVRRARGVAGSIHVRIRIARNLPVRTVHAHVVLRRAGSVVPVRVRGAWCALAVRDRSGRVRHCGGAEVLLDDGRWAWAPGRLLLLHLLLGRLLGWRGRVVEQVRGAPELVGVEDDVLERFFALAFDE